MMEVVVTSGTVRRAKLESDRHHQQTNTQLFTGLVTTNKPTPSYLQVKPHEEKKYHNTQVCSPKLTWGLPSLSQPSKAPVANKQC